MPPRKRFEHEQMDLTALVEDEHINGSMPADESERLKAKEAFYAALSQHPAPERW
jgi:muconolactone delta-isomerase